MVLCYDLYMPVNPEMNRTFTNRNRTYLAPLDLFSRHNNDTRVFLKHHPPEVTYCVLQAALRGDVASL